MVHASPPRGAQAVRPLSVPPLDALPALRPTLLPPRPLGEQVADREEALRAERDAALRTLATVHAYLRHDRAAEALEILERDTGWTETAVEEVRQVAAHALSAAARETYPQLQLGYPLDPAEFAPSHISFLEAEETARRAEAAEQERRRVRAALDERTRATARRLRGGGAA